MTKIIRAGILLIEITLIRRSLSIDSTPYGINPIETVGADTELVKETLLNGE